MVQEKGTISIHTENIFPIIKKFLYSDHEIFLRELVSNAVDATQKIKRLAALSHYNGELGDLKVDVSVNEEAKTITISDNGIGMTAEEIKKYINQIAFSGATEFMEKFKEAKDANEIIGKFGLGFYSAFMVSDKVEIQTLSYQEGSEPARWICDGSTEFEITEGNRTLPIEAEVPNQEGRLRPGMFARADIVLEEAPTIVVPHSALVVFAGVEKLLVVKDGKAHEQRVRTGRRIEDKVEILDGVAAGDLVITAPGGLAEGAAVRTAAPVE